MTTLGSISLTTPWMLAGLSILVLPIAAHLYHRRAAKRVIFPTITLLAEAAASRSRLQRLRGLLLLVMRCLAIVFITLAFTQPVWLGNDDSTAALPTSPNKRHRSGVVIVLDQSASTMTVVGGVSLYDRMRGMAARILRNTVSDSTRIGLVYAKAVPVLVRPPPSGQVGTLRADLEASSPTYEHADMPAALTLAGELLAEVQGERRVIILSDLQRSDWSDTAALQAAAEGLPVGTIIEIIPVTAPDSENISVQLASHTPVVPIVGKPVRVRAVVSNHSRTERVVPVTLLGDNIAGDQRILHLAAGGLEEVFFDVIFTTPGPHGLRVDIPADDMNADDTAFASLSVISRPPVLLITDDVTEQHDGDGYFIARALMPHGDTGNALSLTTRTAAEAASDTTTAFRGVRVAVVAGVETLPEPLRLALHEHLRHGGGVFFLCGSRTPTRDLVALDALDPAGILPFTPKKTTADHRSYITDARWSDAPLCDFGPAAQELFTSLRFANTWSVSDTRDNASVWMTYDDGRPALASRGVGRGVCIVANFGLRAEDSDLARTPPFVALIHALVTYASSPPTTGECFPGESLRLAIPHELRGRPGSLSLRGPTGPLDFTLLEDPTGSITLNLSSVPAPGLYSALLGDQAVTTQAVNLDPRESDPRLISPEELQRLMAATVTTTNFIDPSSHGSTLNRREGTPLWGWAMVLALTTLAAELGLLIHRHF